MIPASILLFVRNSRFPNHGARLARGSREYTVNDGEARRGVATVFVHTSREELAQYERGGYTTDAGTDPALLQQYPNLPARTPLAWKEIPLSDVPAAPEAAWETWDEY